MTGLRAVPRGRSCGGREHGASALAMLFHVGVGVSSVGVTMLGSWGAALLSPALGHVPHVAAEGPFPPHSHSPEARPRRGDHSPPSALFSNGSDPPFPAPWHFKLKVSRAGPRPSTSTWVACHHRLLPPRGGRPSACRYIAHGHQARAGRTPPLSPATSVLLS